MYEPIKRLTVVEDFARHIKKHGTGQKIVYICSDELAFFIFLKEGKIGYQEGNLHILSVFSYLRRIEQDNPTTIYILDDALENFDELREDLHDHGHPTMVNNGEYISSLNKTNSDDTKEYTITGSNDPKYTIGDKITVTGESRDQNAELKMLLGDIAYKWVTSETTDSKIIEEFLKNLNSKYREHKNKNISITERESTLDLKNTIINFKFKRETLVEFKSKAFIVSTLGRDEDAHGIPVKKQSGRYYATSIYQSRYDKNHSVDYDSIFPESLGTKWHLKHISYDSDLDATKMHQENVYAVVDKLKQGLL